jgi:3-phenylpropionate/trans-cinnamate dioxygenase ferredoxin subunit
MMTWKQIGQEPYMEDDTLKEITIGKERILVAKVDQTYYAVQAFCSHMGGDLLKGGLEGYIVSCPRNRSRFDIRDGQPVVWLERMPGRMQKVVEKIQPPKALAVYPIKVADGQIWIDTRLPGGR